MTMCWGILQKAPFQLTLVQWLQEVCSRMSLYKPYCSRQYNPTKAIVTQQIRFVSWMKGCRRICWGEAGFLYMKKIETNIHEQARLARINLAQRTPRWLQSLRVWLIHRDPHPLPGHLAHSSRWHLASAWICEAYHACAHFNQKGKQGNSGVGIMWMCQVRPLIFLAVPCSKDKKTSVTARGARTGICIISLHGVWMKGRFSPCFFDFISGTPECRCFALKTVVSVQPSNHQALPSNKHGKKKTGTCIDLGHESCKLIFAVFLGLW